MNNLKGSLLHARREQTTPNADLTKKNLVLTEPRTVHQILEKYNELKPEKIRADQVRAIEILVTASPDAMAKMNQQQQIEYLKNSLEFSCSEFGKDNLLHAEIHLDEKTPHLTAFFIPKVTKIDKRSGEEKTSLNAKKLLGNKNDFVKRQDKFFENVAQNYGLERGERNSKATHTKIKDWYSRLNKETNAFNYTDTIKTTINKEIENEIEKEIEKNSEKSFLGLGKEKIINAKTAEEIAKTAIEKSKNKIISEIKREISKEVNGNFLFSEMAISSTKRNIKKQNQEKEREINEIKEEVLKKEAWLDMRTLDIENEKLMFEIKIKDAYQKDILQIGKLKKKIETLEKEKNELSKQNKATSEESEKLQLELKKEKGEKNKKSNEIWEWNSKYEKLTDDLNKMEKEKNQEIEELKSELKTYKSQSIADLFKVLKEKIYETIKYFFEYAEWHRNPLDLRQKEYEKGVTLYQEKAFLLEEEKQKELVTLADKAVKAMNESAALKQFRPSFR